MQRCFAMLVEFGQKTWRLQISCCCCSHTLDRWRGRRTLFQACKVPLMLACLMFISRFKSLMANLCFKRLFLLHCSTLYSKYIQRLFRFHLEKTLQVILILFIFTDCGRPPGDRIEQAAGDDTNTVQVILFVIKVKQNFKIICL